MKICGSHSTHRGGRHLAVGPDPGLLLAGCKYEAICFGCNFKGMHLEELTLQFACRASCRPKIAVYRNEQLLQNRYQT